ncbi:unnamed protein product [Prunus brigantina]
MDDRDTQSSASTCPPLVVFEACGSGLWEMSSLSEMSDSQNMGSSGSAFRDDDRDDVQVV